jgi:hypothetical protein
MYVYSREGWLSRSNYKNRSEKLEGLRFLFSILETISQGIIEFTTGNFPA